MRTFSLRHRQAIFDRRLTVSLPVALRSKIWRLLQQYDHDVWIQSDPLDNNWRERSSAVVQVEIDLKNAYGDDELLAFASSDADARTPVDFKGFLLGAYPAQVLDAIEIFQSYLTDQDDWNFEFQRAVNEAFEDEQCPWRLSDGQFFKVDSEFLAVQVLEKAQELMKNDGFHGPLDEFRQARGDLATSDHKGAIVNACNAFESTLKAVLYRDNGTARDLLMDFIDKGYCDDIPETVRPGLRDQVLQSLPFIRNKLGGHGQGNEVVNVPKPYAELAVHLAGSLIQFVIKRASSSSCKPKPEPEFDTDRGGDVPF
jgi:hypothetical protein